jgi:hypothetical protein
MFILACIGLCKCGAGVTYPAADADRADSGINCVMVAILHQGDFPHGHGHGHEDEDHGLTTGPGDLEHGHGHTDANRGENINVKAAFIHALGGELPAARNRAVPLPRAALADTVQSFGVMIAGALIW